MGATRTLAARFRQLGLSAQAEPFLVAAGWDGRFDGATAPNAGSGVSSHQRSLTATERHTRGVHYTGGRTADGILGMISDDLTPTARVGDPACGTGVFLVAAAERLHRAGGDVAAIVADQLFGTDLDARAVALARLDVARWAAERTGRFLPVPPEHLCVGDGLGGDDGPGWVTVEGLLDVAVGNPPFGSQMRGDTVRRPGERARLRERLGMPGLDLTDTAALFLAHTLGSVRAGGVLCLILPSSVAAARSARRIRRSVMERAGIVAVWVGGDDVGFDASVEVWAPVFRVGQPTPARLRRHRGVDVVRVDTVPAPDESTVWAPLLGDLPTVTDPTSTASDVVLGDVATITAGFRQHYYGLVPHVRDDPDASSRDPMLVTTGAIDPLHHRTGRPVRFARRDWTRPVVDIAGLATSDPDLAAWVRGLLVPKVLVASQGRVVEVIADPDGSMVPCTPTIAVVPDGDDAPDVWHVAALLTAPETSLRLHRVAGGTGLGAGACRVTAGFLATVPLPADGGAWDVAAAAAHRASRAAARGDGRAWGAELDVVAAAFSDGPEDGRADGRLSDWWVRRRPAWRGARALHR